jgi:hypothetical protein
LLFGELVHHGLMPRDLWRMTCTHEQVYRADMLSAAQFTTHFEGDLGSQAMTVKYEFTVQPSREAARQGRNELFN